MTEFPDIARVEGPNLVLRLIRVEDAAYVHGLRTNPAYNRHLSEVRGTVDDQRRWIENYQAREAEGHEYYYVIERRDGLPCGVVRLYDIEGDHFAWGSWILDKNKPQKAALESAVLSFGVGFEILGLDQASIDVRVQNEHAITFYRRFGMREVSRTDQDIFLIYPRRRYAADREDFLSAIPVGV